jgi:hypothetical protein
VNDVAYVKRTGSDIPSFKGNTLKQNDGDLYIFPDNTQSGEFVKLGNINYYNYALSASEVEKAFKMGPPNYPAMPVNDKTAQPSYMSAYNRIDIYNM